MRATVRRAVPFICLLVLFTFSVVFQNGVVSTAERDLPAAMEFRAHQGLRVSFSKVESAPVQNGSKFAASALQSGAAAPGLSPGSAEPVELMLTTASYGNIVPINLIRGNYFRVSLVPEENRFAVISDKLAVRLFLTENAVGQTLMLSGTRFTVCGVYRTMPHLMERLSSDGGDIVYIPYASLPQNEKAKPTSLLISGAGTLSMEAAEWQIANAFGESAGSSNYTSYADTLALLREGLKARLFLLGIPVIALLAVLFTRRCKKIATDLGRDDARMARRSAFSAAVCGAAILLLFLFIRFQPYLPGKFLPDDNIFDFGFYSNAVVSSIQAKNAYEGYDFFWNLSSRALCWSTAGTLVSLALFIALFRRGLALGRMALKSFLKHKYFLTQWAKIVSKVSSSKQLRRNSGEK